MTELPQDSCAGCVMQLLLLMSLVLAVGVWMDECPPQEGIFVEP